MKFLLPVHCVLERSAWHHFVENKLCFTVSISKRIELQLFAWSTFEELSNIFQTVPDFLYFHWASQRHQKRHVPFFFYPWISIFSTPLSQEILHFWFISLKLARKLEHDPIAYIWPAAKSWFPRRMAPCSNRFATLMTASTSSRMMSPKKIQRLSLNFLLTKIPSSKDTKTK